MTLYASPGARERATSSALASLSRLPAPEVIHGLCVEGMARAGTVACSPGNAGANPFPNSVEDAKASCCAQRAPEAADHNGYQASCPDKCRGACHRASALIGGGKPREQLTPVGFLLWWTLPAHEPEKGLPDGQHTV